MKNSTEPQELQKKLQQIEKEIENFGAQVESLKIQRLKCLRELNQLLRPDTEVRLNFYCNLPTI